MKKSYLRIFFNSKSAKLPTLNLVSAAAAIKCINILELGKTPAEINLTMPNLICSSSSVVGGVSPITLLKAYVLKPGGT